MSDTSEGAYNNYMREALGHEYSYSNIFGSFSVYSHGGVQTRMSDIESAFLSKHSNVGQNYLGVFRILSGSEIAKYSAFFARIGGFGQRFSLLDVVLQKWSGGNWATTAIIGGTPIIRIGSGLWSSDYTRETQAKENRFVHELAHVYDASMGAGRLSPATDIYSLPDALGSWRSLNVEQRAEVIAGYFSVREGGTTVGQPVPGGPNRARPESDYMESIGFSFY